jgi:hypothetical protein
MNYSILEDIVNRQNVTIHLLNRTITNLHLDNLNTDGFYVKTLRHTHIVDSYIMGIICLLLWITIILCLTREYWLKYFIHQKLQIVEHRRHSNVDKQTGIHYVRVTVL